ncbi:type II toxin-antitoxin system VapC family toxin [Aquitalea sp. ASV11]|uniref:type II toxin-antitoxin system VapC family toxin n=1 Tax=Aquitalea sp. ASV11 TaxID=2795103 RepID=UPI0018EE250F|nr:PIN domain-containing protein [Aquitalea sp. ASV11]
MNGVLVDTSVWVAHFRVRNEELLRLLNQDQVLTHPMVVAELACGTPPAPRTQTLHALNLLRQTQQASLREVMTFIETEKLYGLGCGLVDLVLLASTLISPGTRLWTLDKRLSMLAARFDVQHQTLMH